jgi:hypothetical protein
MGSKIAEDLLNKIQETEKTDPDERIPVIITFEPNFRLDVSALEQEGFDIKNKFSEINAVAGTIPASGIKKLGEHRDIKIMEYDSKVFAL